MSIQFLAPAPGQSFTVRSGATYTADLAGLITGVLSGMNNSFDAQDLLSGGCVPMVPTRYAGRLIGTNFNSTADQAIPLLIPANARFRVIKITVENASVSLTTAAGGVYNAASKGGTALVASSQAYSALTGAGKALDLTLANTDVQAAGTALYLSLTTAQGAAATADVYVMADIFQ